VTVNLGDSAVKGVQALSKNEKITNDTKRFSRRNETIRPLMKMFIDENGKDIGEELTCENA